MTDVPAEPNPPAESALAPAPVVVNGPPRMAARGIGGRLELYSNCIRIAPMPRRGDSGLYILAIASLVVTRLAAAAIFLAVPIALIGVRAKAFARPPSPSTSTSPC